MTHGIFVWNELYTRDVEAAKAFYAATVGWTFEGMPMPDRDQTYWIAKAEGKPAAGILDMRGIVPDGDPPHWLSYLEVDDVDRRIAEIERNGGRIVRQPFDVPDFGRIAIGADATGAFHGLGDHETLTGRIGLRSRPSRLRHLGPDGLQDEFRNPLDRRGALGGAAQQNCAFERRQHIARYLRSSFAAGNHTRSLLIEGLRKAGLPE